MRPALLAILLAAGLTAQAGAQGAPDPVSAVRALYRETPDASVYTDRLRDLLDADRRCAEETGEICNLDLDFLVNGQDVCDDFREEKRFRVIEETGGSAKALADFRNCVPQRLVFDLVRDGDGWFVDDVHSLTDGGWSLSDILQPAR